MGEPQGIPVIGGGSQPQPIPSLANRGFPQQNMYRNRYEQLPPCPRDDEFLPHRDNVNEQHNMGNTRMPYNQPPPGGFHDSHQHGHMAHKPLLRHPGPGSRGSDHMFRDRGYPPTDSSRRPYMPQ